MENPLQAGYPASVKTDACLGFSVMAYQSRGIAHGHCEAYLSTLVRIEGRLSKGLRQDVKVCRCPCCTQATHVAMPPAYSLGLLDGLEQSGIRLWAEFGSWAPRRLAAMEYSMRYIDCHPLPTRWGWAAKAPDFKAPYLFLRRAPGSEPVAVPTIAHAKVRNIAPPTPGNNKEAPEAIQGRPTQDVRPEVQQTLNQRHERRNRERCAYGQEEQRNEVSSFGGPSLSFSRLLRSLCGRLP